MKKLFTLLFTTCLAFTVQAQYCGHTGNPSGPGQCTTTGLEQPGLASYYSIDLFVNGEESTTVIQLQNFDTISFGGQTITIQSLRIDSLGNLPHGLCWATNKADNKFGNKEAGCIKISGTACDMPGQYKLKILVTATVPGGFPIGDGGDLKYFIRLKNTAAPNTPIDSTQTSNNAFIPYGNQALGCVTGLTETTNTIAPISIFPNPLSAKANVHFFSTAAGSFTQTITTLPGNEVYRKETEVIKGENRLTIDAGNLSAGIYFYSISNDSNRTTRKIIIE